MVHNDIGMKGACGWMQQGGLGGQLDSVLDHYYVSNSDYRDNIEHALLGLLPQLQKETGKLLTFHDE